METITELEPRPITEAERLQGLGAPVQLANGKVVNLRYGGRAQRWIEREYGSLKKFQDELDKGEEGIVMTALYDALYAGLLHLKLGTDKDDVLDLLDERLLLDEYLPAFRRAFAQSLPRRAQESTVAMSETTNTANSLGPNSNTSPEQNLDAANPSSVT